MKKIFILTQIIILAFSLTACGEDWAKGGDVSEIRDADGNITKYVVTYKDGTVTDFSPDKLPEYSVQEAPGGTTERFYRDGVIFREIFVGEEGEKENVYDANGNIATEKFSGKGGSAYTKTYHSNGILATEDSRYADGASENYTYNEQGVLVKKEIRKSGISNIVKYNDKGIAVYSYTDNYGDGYTGESFYDDDGNITKQIVSNGIYESAVTEFYGNGSKKLVDSKYRNGIREIIKYNETGEVIEKVIYDADGNIVE